MTDLDQIRHILFERTLPFRFFVTDLDQIRHILFERTLHFNFFCDGLGHDQSLVFLVVAIDLHNRGWCEKLLFVTDPVRISLKSIFSNEPSKSEKTCNIKSSELVYSLETNLVRISLKTIPPQNRSFVKNDCCFRLTVSKIWVRQFTLGCLFLK